LTVQVRRRIPSGLVGLGVGEDGVCIHGWSNEIDGCKCWLN
jgi:hypothetical protein